MKSHVRSMTVAGLLLMSAQPHAADAQLTACPSTPNCVSSQARDHHFIEPFHFEIDADAAWSALIEALQATPRTEILGHNDTHLRATATTLVFRFVDDLEFILNAEHQRIDVRSASRVGYSDFGVNRRRVEHLRQRLLDQGILVKQP